MTTRQFCPTCGVEKKDHSTRQWNIHMQMYKDYKEAVKLVQRLTKKIVKVQTK